MASLRSTSASVLLSFVFFFGFFLALSKAQSVPAVYVLGDSLVDVGNNNYLPSILKADFPHNGIDYAGKKPTGRFSNGKNAADFIAEKVGLPTSPPYLSNKNDVFIKGVSFASGGAGIFNTTQQGFLRKTIPLTQQVGYFATVQQTLVNRLGAVAAQQHLAKSLFPVVIGSNDLFDYFDDSGKKNKVSPQQYVDEMISTLRGLLKRLHELGARKLVVVGIGPLGCTPARRHESSTEDCSDEVNSWVKKYNQQLTSMLQALQSELSDIKYSYFDTYAALTEIIQNPATHGFSEVKAACCGFGKLNADVFCTPLAVYCPNRRDHVFWDKVHPTQATDQILVEQIFSASPPHVFPINLNQLISV